MLRGCPCWSDTASPKKTAPGFLGMAFFKFPLCKKGVTLCQSHLPVLTVLTQIWALLGMVFAKAELLGETSPGTPRNGVHQQHTFTFLFNCFSGVEVFV